MIPYLGLSDRLGTLAVLLGKPALRVSNEREQDIQFFRLRQFLFNSRDGLRCVQAGAGENAKGILERFNVGGRKAGALHSNSIRAVDLHGVVGSGYRIRQHILLNDAAAANNPRPNRNRSGGGTSTVWLKDQ